MRSSGAPESRRRRVQPRSLDLHDGELIELIERSYEVLEPARLTADADNPFWIDRSRAEAEEVSGDGQRANRATIRAEERMKLGAALAVTLMTTGLVTPTLTARDDGQRLLSIDHFVRVTSTVPSMAGSIAHIYVRERVSAGVALRGPTAADRVVLFVHGAGTPAEVAFDVPAPDYSWMAYLAQAGFDVFSMDTTGYGRSTRPSPMDDPCNLSLEQQKQFIPSLIAAPCKPSYPGQLTNIGSDWHDIGAVVDHIRRLRGVERVNLIAWSLGGPRAGGYAAQHPQKVQRLIVLAPAMNPTAPATAPALPSPGVVFNTQSRSEFIANWDRQVGCADQYDPAVRDIVWSEMLASDPVGASWGTGVRRAPQTTTWGWNAAMAGKVQAPALVVAGVHDKQVTPDRVRALYDAIGATEKVLLDLGCASHNAMWERNRLLLFRASLDWLTTGAVGETRTGVVRLGYAKQETGN